MVTLPAEFAAEIVKVYVPLATAFVQLITPDALFIVTPVGMVPVKLYAIVPNPLLMEGAAEESAVPWVTVVVAGE